MMKRSLHPAVASLLLFGGVFFSNENLGPRAVAQDGTISPQPTIVELFTSQGCSSCPPADLTLASIRETAEERNLPIHVLSFHVDYWDAIGWKDPFATSLHTARQRRYARTLGSRRIYTPQMIVGGTTEFVGSNRKLAATAIERSLVDHHDETLDLTAESHPDGSVIRVGYQYQGDASGRVLNVALVQRDAGNEVARGENAGRKLLHVNVVRDFHTTELKKNGSVSLTLPSELIGKPVSVIGYVQDVDTASITTSAQGDLP